MFQRLLLTILLALSLSCSAEALSDTIVIGNHTPISVPTSEERGDTLLSASNADIIEYPINPTTLSSSEVPLDTIVTGNHTSNSVTHSEERGDTLLNVSNADRVEYSINPTTITIVISGLDGSQKNFYYYSKSTKCPNIGKVGSTTFGERIRDIMVIEYPSCVNLCYHSSTDSEYNLFFPITDPYNRSVNCYTGTKNNEFGQPISVPLKKSSSTSWDCISGGLYAGMSTPTYASSDLHTRMGNSWEFGWLQTIGVSMRHRYNGLSLGIGFGTRNIGTDHHYRFIKEGDTDVITLKPFEEGQTNCSSSLRIFQLHMPLLYSLRFGYKRNCSLWIGPVLNFNIAGQIHSKYQIGENTYRISTNNLNQRPVTLDAFMSIGWKGLSIYARFSPMKTLRSQCGLDFSTFSTGIILGI